MTLRAKWVYKDEEFVGVVWIEDQKSTESVDLTYSEQANHQEDAA